MSNVIHHLYYKGTATKLQSGDIIREDEECTLSFHRGDEEMLKEPIGTTRAVCVQSAGTIINAMALATGLDIVETPESEAAARAYEWEVREWTPE